MSHGRVFEEKAIGWAADVLAEDPDGVGGLLDAIDAPAEGFREVLFDDACVCSRLPG